MLIIDDRQWGDFRTRQGTSWRLVTDEVMGGVSEGRLTIDEVDGRPCIRLRGRVRLENRGGFVQAALDLNREAEVDFSRFEPHRIRAPLDVSQLERIGLVAIGRAFSADLCIGHLALYREFD